jgi:hypothetical protein
MRSQILSAEQGVYDNGVWKPLRLWNGDETDGGLCFHEKPEVVGVRLGHFYEEHPAHRSRNLPWTVVNSRWSPTEPTHKRVSTHWLRRLSEPWWG